MTRAIGLALLLSASPAHADTIDHDRKPVIIADAIADGVALSAAIPHLPENVITLLFWGGLLTQAVVPPAIHIAHEDYGRGAIDLGVRIAAPTLGIILGSVICEKVTPRKGEWDFLRCLGGAFIGGVVGIVGAQVVDWTLISRPSDTQPIGGAVMRFGFRF